MLLTRAFSSLFYGRRNLMLPKKVIHTVLLITVFVLIFDGACARKILQQTFWNFKDVYQLDHVEKIIENIYWQAADFFKLFEKNKYFTFFRKGYFLNFSSKIFLRTVVQEKHFLSQYIIMEQLYHGESTVGTDQSFKCEFLQITLGYIFLENKNRNR